MLSNKFIQTSSIFTVTSFLVSITNYLFNLIIARNFTLSDYGEYTTALSYILILSVPITAFSLIVIKKIGEAGIQYRQNLAEKINSQLITLLKTNLVYTVGILAAISYLIYSISTVTFASLFFILTSLIVTLFSTFYVSILQGSKLFRAAGMILVFTALIKLIGGYLLLTYSPQLEYLYLIIIFSMLLTIMIGRKIINFKITTNEFTTSLSDKKTHIAKIALHNLKKKNILISLFTTIGLVGLINFDVILVQKFFAPEEAGLYSAISLLGKIITYVSAPISLVAFSFFTGDDSKSNSKKILLITSIFFIILGASASIFYFYFAEFVVRLIFGYRFIVISPLIFLSAIFGTFYSLIAVFAQYLISKNSWISIAILVFFMIQTILIYYIHDTMKEILVVNICISLILFLILSIFSFKNERTYNEK